MVDIAEKGFQVLQGECFQIEETVLYFNMVQVLVEALQRSPYLLVGFFDVLLPFHDQRGVDIFAQDFDVDFHVC